MTLAIIFSAASLVLCAFFFIYFRAYIKRRVSQAELLADYEDEVNRLIADIDAATERDLTLIENRINTMNALLDTVDRRLAGLVRELDRRHDNEPVYTAMGRKAAGQAPFGASRASPGPADKALQPSPEPAQNKDPPPETRDPVPRGPFPPETFAGKAAKLAETGLSPEEIAVKLSVSVTEVDLALTMANRGLAR
jgi:DNA-binding CsgD family transcriptional regulator